MKPLLLSQWRLVRISFAVFTLVGAFLTPYLAAKGTFFLSPDPAFAPWIALLAASLAARLFAQETVRAETLYWRALPLDRSRWFWIKAGMGLGLLAISLGLQWLVWHSPIAETIFRECYSSQGTTYISTGPLVHGQAGTVQVAFVPPHVASTLALALLAFSGTLYFATSFERASAAWQSGLPGFLFAVLFSYEVMPLAGSALQPLRPWSAILGVFALAHFCAWHLFQRRGTGVKDTVERVLGRGTPGACIAHLVGQLVFVILPVVLGFAAQIGPAGKFVGLTPMEAQTFAWGLLGVLVLPWTIREIRCAGRGLLPRISLLVLRTSGIGIPLWKVLRVQWASACCAKCGRMRDADLRTCPDCAARATRTSVTRWKRVGVAPDEPWGVAVLSVAALVVGQITLQNVHPVAFQYWKVRADLPGVEFVPESTGRSTPFMDGSRRIATPALLSGDHMAALGGEAKLSAEPRRRFTTAELRQALGQTTRGPHSLQDLLPVPIEDAFEIRVQDNPVAIESFRVDCSLTGFSLESTTTLAVRVPALQQQALDLIRAADREQLTPDLIREAALKDEPFFTILVREMTMYIPSRNLLRDLPGSANRPHVLGQRFRDVLDSILEQRLGGREHQDRALAHTLLAEISERASIHAPQQNAGGRPPFNLSYFYAPIRLLSWTAPPDLLSDEILAGNPYAAVAAGMGVQKDCFDACAKILHLACTSSMRGSIDSDWSARLICTAWAMLCIDGARGGNRILDEMIQRGDDGPGYKLSILLAHSNREDLIPRLHQLAADASKSSNSYLQEAWTDSIRGIQDGNRLEEYWLGW